jgi:hypothetical protein
VFLGLAPEDLHVSRVLIAEHFRMTAPEVVFASQMIAGLTAPRPVTRR